MPTRQKSIIMLHWVGRMVKTQVEIRWNKCVKGTYNTYILSLHAQSEGTIIEYLDHIHYILHIFFLCGSDYDRHFGMFYNTVWHKQKWITNLKTKANKLGNCTIRSEVDYFLSVAVLWYWRKWRNIRVFTQRTPTHYCAWPISWSQI